MTLSPDEDAAASLRAERDALAARAEEAERLAEQLAEELAAAREQLASAEAEESDPSSLTLFDDNDSLSPGTGADHGVLPVALGGTAFVLLVVGVLSLVNNGLASPFTLLMLGLAGVLGWTAWQVRPVGSTVHVEDGVVKIERAGSTYRFDLRSETCRVDVLGTPGDDGWRVVFRRGRLDPCTVDASMVDPARFLAEVRKHRPGL